MRFKIIFKNVYVAIKEVVVQPAECIYVIAAAKQ